jgi:hypothetical protein
MRLIGIAWEYDLPTRVDGQWCWTNWVEGNHVVGGARPIRLRR